MHRKLILFSLLLFFTVNFAVCQEKWDLQKCINQAIQNSIAVKQAQIGISRAGNELTRSKGARLPNLNAGVNLGLGFGRSINPITNAFIQNNFLSNTFFVGGNVPVYAGDRINKSIQQSKINLEASKLEAKATENDIALTIAASYLNILLAEEQVENAKKRLEQSESQLAQTDKLIQAGSLPENDRLDILAQMALDQQGIVDAENLVAINYLALKQAMLVDPSVGIIIEKPALLDAMLVSPVDFVLNDVYTNAIGFLPDIKSE